MYFLTKEKLFKNWKPVNVPKEVHLRRREKNNSIGELLTISVNGFDYKSLENKSILVKIPQDILLASNPMFCDYPNGAYGTVESSGCMNLIGTYHLNRYGFNVLVQEVTDAIAEKGGRIIKFNGKSLSIPKFDLELIKEQFPEDKQMQTITNLQELREKYGEETGIGGSFFIFDNLIWALLGFRSEVDLSQTRLTKVENIVENIGNGIPVPMRVSNAVYHNDESRREGHFITLIGIEYGIAIVYDTSLGFKRLPFRQLMKAATANPGLIAAWNLRECDELYLK